MSIPFASWLARVELSALAGHGKPLTDDAETLAHLEAAWANGVSIQEASKALAAGQW